MKTITQNLIDTANKALALYDKREITSETLDLIRQSINEAYIDNFEQIIEEEAIRCMFTRRFGAF